jgi:hypothetical protein
MVPSAKNAREARPYGSSTPQQLRPRDIAKGDFAHIDRVVAVGGLVDSWASANGVQWRGRV